MDGHQRRLLALLGLAIFFEGYGRSLIVVTLSYVAKDLHAAPEQLSFALALISAGSLGVLLLGPLADRFGRRVALLGSVLLCSVLGAATASATTLPGLVAWQAAARMFQEGALFAAAVIATEEMPAAHRGSAQGVLGTVNSFGSGLVAVLLAAIEWWPGGWRGLALVCLVPLATLPFLRREIPESRRWLARDQPARHLPPRAYRGRVLAVLAVVFLSMSYDVAGFAFSTYVPITQYGWSSTKASVMVVIAGGVGLPGWWLGGRIADLWGRRGVTALLLLGLTAAELVFYLGGPAALMPAFAAMVFCQGGKVTVLRAWATELFPTSFRGAAVGWIAASGTLGGIAGLSFAGAVAPAVGGISQALAILTTSGVLAAIGAFAWLPETKGLELEAIAPEEASAPR